VAAGLELSAQLEAAGLKEPEFIYIPCGTMGTVAGLAIGLHLAGRRSRIVAARVVPPAVASVERLDKFCRELNRELRARDRDFPLLDEPMANIELRDDVLGDGYGSATPEGTEAVTLFAEHTGLNLEMTYTGKALAALGADARAGRLAGHSALFWNTYNSAPYPAALAGITLADLPDGLVQAAHPQQEQLQPRR
jgi:D-cysteine desulfhydrase